jgi:hypothetical protein
MDPNEIIPPPVSPSPASAVPLVTPFLTSGMYWRKSKLFGWLCPTGILTLEEGRLRFVTAKETVFDSPVSAVNASFSGWGTLTLTVDGTSYDFVGSGGGMSGSFSAAQKAELAEAAGRHTNPAVSAAGVGVASTGIGGGAILAVDVVSSLVGSSINAGVYASGVNILKQWPAVLESQGAAVHAKKPNYMWWLFGAMAAGLALAVVIYVIVS